MRLLSNEGLRRFGALVGVGLLLGACQSAKAPTAHVTDPRLTLLDAHHDPKDLLALRAVATAFNWAYATNHDAAVWQRWDPQSRAIISEHDYVTRHRDCNTAPGAAVTLGISEQGNRYLVTYSISGVSSVDTWFYVDGRWEFDLPASNPQAVALYRLPTATYLKTLGCNH